MMDLFGVILILLIFLLIILQSKKLDEILPEENPDDWDKHNDSAHDENLDSKRDPIDNVLINK